MHTTAIDGIETSACHRHLFREFPLTSENKKKSGESALLTESFVCNNSWLMLTFSNQTGNSKTSFTESSSVLLSKAIIALC